VHATGAAEHTVGVDERCAECGFDPARVTLFEAIATFRSLGLRWGQLLEAAGDRVRERPAPDVWSPLEYAAHTRDVLALHAWALEQVFTVERPVFPEVGEAEMAASAAADADADPHDVAVHLGVHASHLADVAALAPPEAWQRPARIGERTVDGGYLVRHALHDATHHLLDVERQVAET